MDFPGVMVDPKEEEDPLLIKYSLVKAESEIVTHSTRPQHTCDSKTCLTSCVTEHEMIGIKDESTSAITAGPVGKAEHENSMDFVKHEPDLCSESCPAVCDDKQAMNVKVEDHLDVEDQEYHVPVGVASVNTEWEQSPLNEHLKNEDIVSNELLSTKTHQEQHHYKHRGERSYTCDACGKSFRHPSGLKRHQPIHSGERPYICDVCAKSFSNQSALKTHERMHSGEHVYTCDVCGKSFSHPSGLRRHQRIHNGERPYTCDACERSFSDRTGLKTHQRMHSGERPYVCSVCSKALSHQSALKRHLRIHSGERPYVCGVCNKSFIQKDLLKTHLRIHSGERPYPCDVCALQP